jgi:hypothetical protein
METDRALEEWQGLGAKWQSLRGEEVAALNRDLAKARLPRLRAELEPPRDLDLADEE